MADDQLKRALDMVTELATSQNDYFVSTAEYDLLLLKGELSLLKSFIEATSKMAEKYEVFKQAKEQIIVIATKTSETIEPYQDQGKMRTNLLGRAFKYRKSSVGCLERDVRFLTIDSVEPMLKKANKLFEIVQTEGKPDEMEQKMADAAVTIVLDKAAELQKMNGSHADSELRQLIDELRSLKPFLELAAEVAEEGNSRDMEQQIMEFVGNAEKQIDSWLTEARRSKNAGKSRNKSKLEQKVSSLITDTVKPMLEKHSIEMESGRDGDESSLKRNPLETALDAVMKLATMQNDDFISTAKPELLRLKGELSLLKSFIEATFKMAEKYEVFKQAQEQIDNIATETIDTIESSLERARKRTNLLGRAFKYQKSSVGCLAQDVKLLTENVVQPMLKKADILFEIVQKGKPDEMEKEMADALLRIVLDKAVDLQKMNGSDAESELQQLIDKLRSLKQFLELAAEVAEEGISGDMEQQIMKVVGKSEKEIDSWLTEARRSNNVSALERKVRSLREDTVQPMLVNARTLFDEMGSGRVGTSPLKRKQQARRSNNAGESLNKTQLPVRSGRVRRKTMTVKPMLATAMKLCGGVGSVRVKKSSVRRKQQPSLELASEVADEGPSGYVEEQIEAVLSTGMSSQDFSPKLEQFDVSPLRENTKKPMVENAGMLVGSAVGGGEDFCSKLKQHYPKVKSLETLKAAVAEQDEVSGNVEQQIEEVVSTSSSSQDFSPKPEQLDVSLLRENTKKPIVENAGMLVGSAVGGKDFYSKLKQVGPSIDQRSIIGFLDEEIKIVDELLNETKKELDVISIIGVAGLGKTTLAAMIYHNPVIKHIFPTRIWVTISPVFNKKDMILTILEHFTKEDKSRLRDLRDECIAHKLYEYLEKEKFFLVLDDISSVDDWKAIQEYVLPKTNLNGKVLITSRSKDVGGHVNLNRKPHDLRLLTKKEIWNLLWSIVFGGLNDYPQELIGIAENIANNCDGIPRKIRSIGSDLQLTLLGGKGMSEIKKRWNIVYQNLSYNRLPDDLKDCFLYLGVFPEDYEIPVWTLINLWIVEGFVQHKDGMTLEEIAEENLKDLIGRNLVMVGKTDPLGKVKTCRVCVHDLIRSFRSYTAAITQRNLFQEIKKSEKGNFEPSISDMQNYRRVCIYSDLLDFLSTEPTSKPTIQPTRKPPSQSIRSFLCFHKEPVTLDQKHSAAIQDAFRLLRVLHTYSIKFIQFPKEVTNLIHLRYITLCCDDLKFLPEDISKLWNLQVLVVDTNSASLTVKANIWRMTQLRHVKTKAAIVLEIEGEESKAAENLRTLSRLSPKSCTKGVTKNARNLKKLGIRGQLATLDAECLRELVHLENLKLVNDLNDNTSLHHLALELFPKNLKKLTLSATYLNWEHLSQLGQIDTLQILKLVNYAFTGESWKNTSGPGFRCLEFLLIDGTDLVSWEASTNDFPRLSFLVLKNCKQLSKIPRELTKSLKKLDIENLSTSAVESAREIGEKEKANGFKLSIGAGCE